MLNASATEEVPQSADAVWKVIGDFDDIRKWAPAIMATVSEQTPEGRVRTLTMPPDGKQVKELRIADSQYSYTYTVIGGVKGSSSTVSVVPVDGSKSRIELKAEFAAPAGTSDEDAVAGRMKFLRGNIKAMKKALGLA